MSILSLALLLHFNVVVNLNNYYFSSGIVDDTLTIVQAQSPDTFLKSITKLNSFFFSLTTNKDFLFKENKSFYGNRIFNTIVNPAKQEHIHTKTNPILILLINTRCTAIKYVL